MFFLAWALAVAAPFLILGVIALLRANREDIPAIAQAIFGSPKLPVQRPFSRPDRID